jgi:D-sedoheptulose 7-phosphate isomerase
MKETTCHIIDNLFRRMPELKYLNEKIQISVEKIINLYNNNNKLLICGNGGSASDSLHIVGELMKDFKFPRGLDKKFKDKINELYPENSDYFINNLSFAIPAISLVSEISLNTAFSNDNFSDLVFAQQVLGYGKKGDILIAISTSGNSKNVLYASQIAKSLNMLVISLTGRTGGELKKYSDILIDVPTDETFLVQEYHLPIYHAICASVENELFSKGSD